MYFKKHPVEMPKEGKNVFLLNINGIAYTYKL